MESICNNLITTFNMNILNNQTNIVKAAFYSKAKEFENTKKDNVIFKLIRNHFNNKKPVVDFLGGPNVIEHLYNEEYNMNIYLFGEYHSYKTDCPKINKKKVDLVENYFSNLIKNTNVFLDIYFEFPAYDNGMYKYTNIFIPQRINELFKKFYICIQNLTRKNKKCELSRIHYVDVRSEMSDNKKLNELSWFIINIINNNNKTLINSFFKNNIERIKKIFNNLTLSKENYVIYIIEQIYTNKYVEKEIRKSFASDKILDFYTKEIEKETIKHYDKIKKLISNININAIDMNNLSSLTTLFIFINSYILDAYSVARMLKKFKVIDKLSQPEIPHNIIHYSGNAHTSSIYKCLRFIGFKDIENNLISRMDFLNCSNMNTIKQPLFSI